MRLPADLPNTTYAALAQVVWSVLSAAGLGDDSSLRPDEKITDEELNAAFDKGMEGYPWEP